MSLSTCGSFTVFQPVKLRTSRLKLLQERFRLDQRKMTMCDGRQVMAPSSKKRLGKFISGWINEAHICLFFFFFLLLLPFHLDRGIC
jgi:hypothetical protein